MEYSLQHFETFLSVAELSSFSGAARQLGVSRSAVSHTISLLEKSLQTPLFIRSTRRIQLTEEGDILRRQCLKLKRELDGAREIVAGLHANPSGRLRVSCNPYFSDKYLVKLLSLYRQHFPQVILEVIAEERMPDMDKEQVDIVFGVNWPAPLDAVAKKIASTRYVLCASPDYLQQHGTPLALADLVNHQYLVHAGRSMVQPIVNQTIPDSISLESKLSLNSAHLMKACALQNLGITQLHEYMVRDELNKGELIEVLPDLSQETVSIYVYYQKHRYVQPKVKQFIRLLSEYSFD